MELRAVVAILPVRDLDRSERFYARLGLARAHRYRDYLILVRDGLELHLRPAPIDPASNPCSIYLRVNGIDAYATAFGCTAEDQPWGQREIALDDPVGNLVRLGEPVRAADPAG